MNKIQTNTIFTRIEILIQLLFNFKPKKLLQLFLLIRKVRRGGRRNGRKFGDRVEERGRIKNLTWAIRYPADVPTGFEQGIAITGGILCSANYAGASKYGQEDVAKSTK